MTADPDEVWSELEREGEPEVRRKLTIGAYGDRKRPAVEAWLQSKNAERAARVDDRDHALRVQEIADVRSSKRAAWVAAVLSAIFAALHGLDRRLVTIFDTIP